MHNRSATDEFFTSEPTCLSEVMFGANAAYDSQITRDKMKSAKIMLRMIWIHEICKDSVANDMDMYCVQRIFTSVMIPEHHVPESWILN